MMAHTTTNAIIVINGSIAVLVANSLIIIHNIEIAIMIKFRFPVFKSFEKVVLNSVHTASSIDGREEDALLRWLGSSLSPLVAVDSYPTNNRVGKGVN